MIDSNYHIHTKYCDGDNSPNEIVTKAIDIGLTSIGFSGHMSLPFENDWTMPLEKVQNYIDEIDKIKVEYKNKISIYSGLEVDFFIDENDISPNANQFIKQVDFFIGSIHCIGFLSDGNMAYVDDTIDSYNAGICELYGNDVKLFIKRYYQAFANYIKKYSPDIIGHLDLVKMHNNNIFSENEHWYKSEVMKFLECVKNSSSIIEINTRKFNSKSLNKIYPSKWILEQLFKMDIPITINADTHNLNELVSGYSETEALIKKIGFRSMMIRCDSTWESRRL